MGKGDWWLKLDIHDWLNDPKLRRLGRANRDSWLTACLMMRLEGEFSLVGTAEELANMVHLTAAEFEDFVADLKRTNVASVTLRNKIVTIMSRRYKREAKSKEQTRLRVAKLRGNADVTPKKRDRVKSKKKEVREEEELREEAATPPAPTPEPIIPPEPEVLPDSPFDNPAVVLYEEQFGVKTGRNFRNAIVERVKSLGVWKKLLTDNAARADRPLAERNKIANWILTAYNERVAAARNSNGNGDSKSSYTRAAGQPSARDEIAAEQRRINAEIARETTAK